MLQIKTNKNFNSYLFDLIVNSNKLTSTPYKLPTSIVINRKDALLVEDIAKKHSLKILDSILIGM